MNWKRNSVHLSFLCLPFILLFGFTTSVAQSLKMDSLIGALHNQVEDTSKVDVLLELSFGHYQIDVSQCRAYGEEALRISENLNDTLRIAQSYNCLGIASDLEGHPDQAINYWEKCLELSEKTNFQIGKMKSLNNLGIAHKEKGNIEKSLEYFLGALKIEEDKGNIKQSVNTLSNIGYLYLSMNDLEHAFHYLQQAIKSGEQLGVSSILSHPYQRMGEYYVQKKEYDSALLYLNKALDICKEFDHNLRLTTTLRLIGQCEFYLGKKEKAIASFKEAENMLGSIGEKYTELYTLWHTWATAYKDLGDYDKAFEKANMAFALAEKNELESCKLSSLQLLGQLYEETENHRKALYYHKAASTQQDSLHLRSKEELLLTIETKYQSDKKEVENILLRTQQEKIQSELKTKNAWMIAAIFGSILVGIVAFLLLRANQIKQDYNEELQDQVSQRTKELKESNNQLKQSNIELEKFAFIVSHDLKTPLHNIVCFTGLLERRLGDHGDPKIQEYINFLKAGGKRMHALIEDVLEFSNLPGEQKNKTSEIIDLNILCKDLTITIQSTLEERKAKIEIDRPLPIINSNYSSFFLLFKNLVENAIKYNESAIPRVEIQYEIHVDSFSLIFKDNGIGIQEKYFEVIWEMFGRLHSSSVYDGSGLGLAICKKIMDTLNGSIKVSSIVGKGSTFELIFPKLYLAKNPINNQQTLLKV